MSSITESLTKFDDGPKIMLCALWYDDEFLRTADGWRITRRVETKCMDKLL